MINEVGSDTLQNFRLESESQPVFWHFKINMQYNMYKYAVISYIIKSSQMSLRCTPWSFVIRVVDAMIMMSPTLHLGVQYSNTWHMIHDIKYQVSPYSITINYRLDRNIGICGSINGYEYDCKSFVRLFNVAGLYDVTTNPHITWRVCCHLITHRPWYFATRARGAWYHVTCARDVTHSEIFWYFGRCYNRFYCLCCIYWGTPVRLCLSYYCHWVVVLSKGVLFGISLLSRFWLYLLEVCILRAYGFKEVSTCQMSSLRRHFFARNFFIILFRSLLAPSLPTWLL